MMKKYILILVLIITFSADSLAQKQRGERLKTFKVGFLTERLNLTAKEAQQFWPIYNAFDDKMEVLRKKEFSTMRTIRQNQGNFSEKEAQEVLQALITSEQEKLGYKTQLVEDLKGVLSVKKILILLKTEEDFKKRLLEELQKRRRRN